MNPAMNPAMNPKAPPYGSPYYPLLTVRSFIDTPEKMDKVPPLQALLNVCYPRNVTADWRHWVLFEVLTGTLAATVARRTGNICSFQEYAAKPGVSHGDVMYLFDQALEELKVAHLPPKE